MSALFGEWVEDSEGKEVLAHHASETDGENVGVGTFPFTEAGLELAAQYACRNGGYTTPRDIQKMVDDLLNRAIDDGRHVVSSVYLHALINA